MSECDECGRESNDTMEMTVARLTAEAELSKRVVTAHRKLCDERSARIKDLEAALAEAEAKPLRLLTDMAEFTQERGGHPAMIANLHVARDFVIDMLDRGDREDAIERVNWALSARREKGREVTYDRKPTEPPSLISVAGWLARNDWGKEARAVRDAADKISELTEEVARLTAEADSLRKVVDLTNEVRNLRRITEAAAKCGGDVVFSNIRYWNADSELDTMLDKVAAEVTRLTEKGK